MSQLGDVIESIHPEDTCYSLLFSRTAICDDCPLGKEEGHGILERSFIFNKEGNGIYLRETISVDDEVIFLTFHDNISEVFLQKEMDSIKNELVAKNILLSKYRSGNEENRGLNQIIDNLPDALVTVDNSMNVRIINKKAKLDFPAINVSKCYELFGINKPCKSCPVEDGVSEIQDFKTSHFVDGKFYTEIFNSFKKEEGGLLIFRDNTRQIDLIEQIRRQNETINRKNEILSSLVKLEAKMQGDKNIKSVLEYFIDLFLPLYQSESIVLIANDIRAGSVWFSLGRGISDKKIKLLTQIYFSRDTYTIGSYGFPDESLPWPDTVQINLIGRNDKLVGMIFVKGRGAADWSEIIELFKDPLSAYLHGQILIKLLKERADTDALTGLYNRRYLQKAMEQEKNKLEKYGINYSIAVVDINGLKDINDRYGHETGDQMISLVAHSLKKSTRESDIVARTGGDEYIILLTNTDNNGADKYMEKLNKEVFNNLYIDLDEKQKIQVTVSAGIATSNTCLPDDLIKQADKLMYENKRTFYKSKLQIEENDEIKALKEVKYNMIDRVLE